MKYNQKVSHCRGHHPDMTADKSVSMSGASKIRQPTSDKGFLRTLSVSRVWSLWQRTGDMQDGDAG